MVAGKREYVADVGYSGIEKPQAVAAKTEFGVWHIDEMEGAIYHHISCLYRPSALTGDSQINTDEYCPVSNMVG